MKTEVKAFSQLKLGQIFQSMNGPQKYVKVTSKKAVDIKSDDDGIRLYLRRQNEAVIVEAVEKPKVLIYVKGGVAEFVIEGNVDVAKYDADDAEVDPEGNPPLPKAFASLAKQLHLPVESS